MNPVGQHRPIAHGQMFAPSYSRGQPDPDDPGFPAPPRREVDMPREGELNRFRPVGVGLKSDQITRFYQLGPRFPTMIRTTASCDSAVSAGPQAPHSSRNSALITHMVRRGRSTLGGNAQRRRSATANYAPQSVSGSAGGPRSRSARSDRAGHAAPTGFTPRRPATASRARRHRTGSPHPGAEPGTVSRPGAWPNQTWAGVSPSGHAPGPNQIWTDPPRRSTRRD